MMKTDWGIELNIKRGANESTVAVENTHTAYLISLIA